VWTDNSDRTLKAAFAAADADEVLAKVAALPINTWEYEAEPGARHLGPTAQDFYSAFGLGASDRHIASLDSSGVALTAIQGLAERNEELERTVADQGERLEALEDELGIATAGG
jgi:trimeric autotransporter adhesin